jgi:hypothetical protein
MVSRCGDCQEEHERKERHLARRAWRHIKTLFTRRGRDNKKKVKKPKQPVNMYAKVSVPTCEQMSIYASRNSSDTSFVPYRLYLSDSLAPASSNSSPTSTTDSFGTRGGAGGSRRHVEIGWWVCEMRSEELLSTAEWTDDTEDDGSTPRWDIEN